MIAAEIIAGALFVAIPLAFVELSYRRRMRQLDKRYGGRH